MVPRIVEHMRKTGEWGEFFPLALSPFPYNDTNAHEFFPLSKSAVESKGLKWREADARSYKISMKSEQKCRKKRNLPCTISTAAIFQKKKCNKK